MQTEDFAGFVSCMIKIQGYDKNEEDCVLFMDNARIHSTDLFFRHIFDKFPCIYNAPYTHQFNCIEEVFARIKWLVRIAKPRTHIMLVKAIINAVKSITPDFVRRCIWHTYSYLLQGIDREDML